MLICNHSTGKVVDEEQAMSQTQNRVANLVPKKKCPKPDERLPIILRGIEEGKSNRKIADELGCDEGTARFDRRKLALPPEEQAAIQSGDSAEKYLNAALLRETGIDRSARNKIGRRRREDAKTGKHSAALERALLGWLSSKLLTNSNTLLVLMDALSWSEPLLDGQPEAQGRKFGEVVAPLERDPHPDLRITPPEPSFIKRCVTELVRALIQVEPVQVIRLSALEKPKKQYVHGATGRTDPNGRLRRVI
jgi:hypothetical protein